ncbi:hypothetical protein DICA3_F00738 [Diutina catenulata]
MSTVPRRYQKTGVGNQGGNASPMLNSFSNGSAYSSRQPSASGPPRHGRMSSVSSSAMSPAIGISRSSSVHTDISSTYSTNRASLGFMRSSYVLKRQLEKNGETVRLGDNLDASQMPQEAARPRIIEVPSPNKPAVMPVVDQLDASPEKQTHAPSSPADSGRNGHRRNDSSSSREGLGPAYRMQADSSASSVSEVYASAAESFGSSSTDTSDDESLVLDRERERNLRSIAEEKRMSDVSTSSSVATINGTGVVMDQSPVRDTYTARPSRTESSESDDSGIWATERHGRTPRGSRRPLHSERPVRRLGQTSSVASSVISVPSGMVAPDIGSITPPDRDDSSAFSYQHDNGKAPALRMRKSGSDLHTPMSPSSSSQFTQQQTPSSRPSSYVASVASSAKIPPSPAGHSDSPLSAAPSDRRKRNSIGGRVKSLFGSSSRERPPSSQTSMRSSISRPRPDSTSNLDSITMSSVDNSSAFAGSQHSGQASTLNSRRPSTMDMVSETSRSSSRRSLLNKIRNRSSVDTTLQPSSVAPGGSKIKGNKYKVHSVPYNIFARGIPRNKLSNYPE